MKTNVGLKFLRFMNQHKPETSAQGDEGMEFKLTLNPRICNEESPEYISQSLLPQFSAIREAVQDESFHEIQTNINLLFLYVIKFKLKNIIICIQI